MISAFVVLFLLLGQVLLARRGEISRPARSDSTLAVAMGTSSKRSRCYGHSSEVDGFDKDYQFLWLRSTILPPPKVNKQKNKTNEHVSTFIFLYVTYFFKQGSGHRCSQSRPQTNLPTPSQLNGSFGRAIRILEFFWSKTFKIASKLTFEL